MIDRILQPLPHCVHEDLSDEQPPPLTYGSDSDSDCESEMDTSDQRCRSDTGFFLTGREDFETFVEKVTQSRTLTVLWNRRATMQGWSSWDDLDKGDLSAILQRFRQVQKAYLPECALTHPRLTQHNLRFTSGWEEFFNDVCQVTLSLWSNPWSSPTAEYWHPDDTGGLGIDSQTPLLQVLNRVTAGSACFVNTAECPNVPDDVFRILNRKMRSFEDFRLVFVIKRDASSKWNSFLQTWEHKGRAALCGAVCFMNFRTYGVHKETWSGLNGPWDVYILESGIKPVGHLLSAHDYSISLRNLVGGKSNSEWFPLPSFSDGHAYKGHSGFQPSDVQSFWDAWDEIALKRDALLKSKPVDWSAVRDSLQESNLLLMDAKDTRLRRIARLAKLHLTWSLDEVGSWVYTICGPYPPYVGQTGCFRNTRSCLDRYREHLQKAKSLANHFFWHTPPKNPRGDGFWETPLTGQNACPRRPIKSHHCSTSRCGE